MKNLILSAALALSLVACKGKKEEAKTETTAEKMVEKAAPVSVDGTWTTKSAMMAGNPFPQDIVNTMTLKIENGRYETSAMGQVETGSLVMYKDASPMRMDITAADGPMAGRTLKAIYKVEGGVMTVAYDMSGAAYPNSFSSTAENGYILSTYSR